MNHRSRAFRGLLAASAASVAIVLSACTPGGTTLVTAQPHASASPTALATPAPAPSPTISSPYAWASACDLLSGIDLNALMGEPAAAPHATTPWRCQISSIASGSTAAVDLYVTSPGGADDFAYQRDLQGVDHELEGLGDQAFRTGGYLHVLVGDDDFTLVVIRHPFGTTALTPEEQIEAARTVLQNTGW